jgi:hypothetical protein
MTQEHVAILLCALGGTYLLTAWIGRMTGDARRDVRLALGTAGVLIASGGLLFVA